MKKYKCFLLLLLVIVLCTASDIRANEVKKGDKVTILAPETMARLCPYPSCEPDKHIANIPTGTVLTVESIMGVKSGWLPTIEWFEVTYMGKKGWISILWTDKDQS